MPASFDAIVIGAGHNGLLLGAYLAKSGASTLLVEHRWEVGGPMDTQELFGGFRFNLHATYVIVHGANPPAYEDLELNKFGLRWIVPEIGFGCVFPDKKWLALYSDPKKTAKLIERFSKKDAETFLKLFSPRNYEIAMNALRILCYMAPHEIEDRSPFALIIETLRKMDHFDPTWIEAPMMKGSEELFEDYRVRTMLFRVVEASMMEPERSSLWPLMWLVPAYFKLGIVRGGTHVLAHVLARVILHYGGMIIENNPVTKIIIKNGRATGVILRDGRRIEAKKLVASSLNPQLTLQLAGEEENFPSDIVDKVKRYRYRSKSLGALALALKERPKFEAAEFHPDIERCAAPCYGWNTPEDYIKTSEQCERGEVPRDEDGYLRIEAANALNIVDRSLAPNGYYAITPAWIYLPNTRLKEGLAEKLQEMREELLSDAIETLKSKIPNITKDNIVGASIYLASDVEKKNPNMWGGEINVGTFEGQAGWRRPFEEWGKFKAEPIENLYLCGPSSHSGGGIKFSNGYLCFKVIAKDFKLKFPWNNSLHNV